MQKSSSINNKSRQSLGNSHIQNNDNSSPSDAIKVICRFRPIKSQLKDPDADLPEHILVDGDSKSVTIIVDAYDRKAFAFDKILPPSCSQKETFQQVEGVVDSVLAGFNGAILAYGQTAAGKSFTMEGPSLFDLSSQGVISRSVDKLFRLIQQADDTIHFQIIASYFEIYCEKLRDLLNPQQDNMKIRESKTEGFLCQELTEAVCTDCDSVLRVIELGKANRAAAPTLMNAESSRSHSIFSLSVIQKNTSNGRVKKARLFLVDLAGSEKVSKTGASGLRLEEAKNINSSLTSLGMVINALCENSPHVPYRDSKLTRMLQDALGGNSKTALIICCAPESQHMSETISTLRFGERAKRVKNKARINEELSIDELKNLLQAAKKEIKSLKRRLTSEFSSPMNSPNALYLGSLDDTGDEDIDVMPETLLPSNISPADLSATLITEYQEEIDRMSQLNESLEYELNDNKMQLENEIAARRGLESEAKALQGTVNELQEKLLKMTMESRETIKPKEVIASESDDYYDDNEVDNQSSTISELQSEISSTPLKQNIKTEPLASPSAAVSTSLVTLYKTLDEALLSLTPQVTNEKNSIENEEIPVDVNDSSAEEAKDEPSVIDMKEKFELLREDFDKHLTRLNKKLSTQTQIRKQLENKLEQALERIAALQSTTSPTNLNVNTVAKPSSSYPSIFSMFINTAITASSPTNESMQSKEWRLSRSLASSQVKVEELKQEIEAINESHAIVLETKDSVLRQLIKQNSQVTSERDALTTQVQQMHESMDKLKSLLTSLSQDSRTLMTLQKHRGSITGGTPMKGNR